MTKINSKNKGNTYERKIANLLSERFKDFTGIEKSFRRSQDSGSFFGASNQKRLNTHNTDKISFGDIICPNNFKFNIECKHYKCQPLLSAILKNNVKNWDIWIKQATQDSKNSNLIMMIIIKYNNMDDIVILDNNINIQPKIVYKNEYYIYNLKDILLLSNEYFFQI